MAWLKHDVVSAEILDLMSNLVVPLTSDGTISKSLSSRARVLADDIAAIVRVFLHQRFFLIVSLLTLTLSQNAVVEFPPPSYQTSEKGHQHLYISESHAAQDYCKRVNLNGARIIAESTPSKLCPTSDI
jgi:hypothetical protein